MSEASKEKTSHSAAPVIGEEASQDIALEKALGFSDDDAGSGEVAQQHTRSNEPTAQRSDASAMSDTDGETPDVRQIDRPKDLDEMSMGSMASISYPLGQVSMKQMNSKAPWRMNQHLDHVILTKQRIRMMEDRIRSLEGRPPSPQSETRITPEPEIRIIDPEDAIPELNCVTWPTFRSLAIHNKGLSFRYRPHHAVDVLIGEPRLYHERQKIFAPVSEALEKDEPIKEFPERIRINSRPLILILCKLSGRFVMNALGNPPVILRPYTLLVYYREELKAILDSLENKWGATVDEAGQKVDGDARDSERGQTGLANESEKAKEDQEDGPDEEGLESEQNDETEVFPIKTPVEESLAARNDLRCLLRFFDNCWNQLNDRLDPRTHINPKVQFCDLWYLFHPGIFAFSNKSPQKVWRVLHATAGRNYLSPDPDDLSNRINIARCSPFTLNCYYIDYDGKEYGPVQHKFEIQPYDRWKDVISLDLYPVSYGHNSSEALAALNARGKKFVETSRSRHMYYKGRTLIRSPAGGLLEFVKHSEDVESAVVVDFDRTLQFNPNWRPELGWGDRSEQKSRETREMTTHSGPCDGGVRCCLRGPAPPLNAICLDPFCCYNENIDYDARWDQIRADDFYQERNKAVKAELGESGSMIEEELALLPT